MTGRCIRSVVAVAACVLPQLGCLSANPFTGKFAASASAAETPGRPQAELPGKQVEELCLTAAQELEKNGYDAEALAQYEKVRRLNPLQSQIARHLAVLYDRQGDYARARAEYYQAVQANPQDAELLNDLGYCNYEQGNWVEAEKWLREALAINPGYQRAWINLGLALAQQERYQESYKAFIRVVSPAAAHSNLGIVLAKQGKIEDAKPYLRQALAADPDLAQARAALALLEKPVPRALTRKPTAEETPPWPAFLKVDARPPLP